MRRARLDTESLRHPIGPSFISTWSLSDIPWDQDDDDDTDEDDWDEDEDDDDEEEPEWIVS